LEKNLRDEFRDLIALIKQPVKEWQVGKYLAVISFSSPFFQ
jgi:hypothetical protein